MIGADGLSMTRGLIWSVGECSIGSVVVSGGITPGSWMADGIWEEVRAGASKKSNRFG